jgi:LacI family transcriptional regulator
MGFDNLELAAVVTPPLTTISQPTHAIGQAAVEILLRKSNVPEQRVFGVSVIERQSCRALSASANSAHV